MKRNLCYKHHTAEFDKLPNSQRHMAADWRTVEPCELCEAERADLLAAMETLITDIDSCETEEDFVLLANGFAVEQARAALAGARGEGGENCEKEAHL